MSDAETLEIKKRARRRLVGAVALALSAALVLPLVMEHEPHPGGGDFQLSIPPRPGSSTAAALEELAPPLPPPPGEEVEPPPLPSPPLPVKAPATAPVAPKPPTPIMPTAPAAKSAKAAEQAEQRDEAARARAALAGDSQASIKSAPRSDHFVLQIGAFADAEKAQRLSAELKQRGFPAYTEPAGKITRVRIGPLEGRAAADKTAAELALLGYSTVSSPL